MNTPLAETAGIYSSGRRGAGLKHIRTRGPTRRKPAARLSASFKPPCANAGIPGMTAWGASKAALMGLVKGITAEYADQGIRANALLPGGTDTG